MNDPYVLVLYYSHYGATRNMAQLISRGVEQESKLEARQRTVPTVSSTNEASEPLVPENGPVYCSEDD